MNILNILRASSVKRWHIVNTLRTQTLAEHTFNVTMMARDVCRRLNIADMPAIKIALEHDLDEVIFGDIPSPGKVLTGIKVPFRGKHTYHPPIYYEIVKMCDLIDAYIFISEYKMDRLGEESISFMVEAMKQKMDVISANYPDAAMAISEMLMEMDTGELEGVTRVGV